MILKNVFELVKISVKYFIFNGCNMIWQTKETHPKGEYEIADKKIKLVVDTYGVKVHVKLGPNAKVTLLGQLPFFIKILAYPNFSVQNYKF